MGLLDPTLAFFGRLDLFKTCDPGAQRDAMPCRAWKTRGRGSLPPPSHSPKADQRGKETPLFSSRAAAVPSEDSCSARKALAAIWPVM